MEDGRERKEVGEIFVSVRIALNLSWISPWECFAFTNIYSDVVRKRLTIFRISVSILISSTYIKNKTFKKYFKTRCLKRITFKIMKNVNNQKILSVKILDKGSSTVIPFCIQIIFALVRNAVTSHRSWRNC